MKPTLRHWHIYLALAFAVSLSACEPEPKKPFKELPPQEAQKAENGSQDVMPTSQTALPPLPTLPLADTTSIVPAVVRKSTGESFSLFYSDKYEQIMNARHYKSEYACAATLSTALDLFGFNVRRAMVTNEVETDLRKLGWKATTLATKADYALLKPGDVVFTTKADSNVAGTWSHVYVFVRWQGISPNYALVNDNQGRENRRNVQGEGRWSTSVLFFRAPDTAQ